MSTSSEMPQNGARARRARTLYIVDIENLKGAGAMSDEDSHLIRKTLFELFPRRSEDLVVVGSGCDQSLLASRIWTGARLAFRKGHNGADLALLDVLKNENVAQRFDRLVLASGDWYLHRHRTPVGQRGHGRSPSRRGRSCRPCAQRGCGRIGAHHIPVMDIPTRIQNH